MSYGQEDMGVGGRVAGDTLEGEINLRECLTYGMLKAVDGELLYENIPNPGLRISQSA